MFSKTSHSPYVDYIGDLAFFTLKHAAVIVVGNVSENSINLLVLGTIGKALLLRPIG